MTDVEAELDAYAKSLLERDDVYFRNVTTAFYTLAKQYAVKEVRFYVFGEDLPTGEDDE